MDKYPADNNAQETFDMLKLKTREQLWIGLALGLLMAVTRGQHVAGIAHPLPDASLAIFFLAGVYLRPLWVFAALFAEGFVIDSAAVSWGGVSGFCLSPAYLFLVPAYGAMWWAGRWYSERYRLAWPTLIPLIGSILFAAVAAELLASGGFYLFSGRFPDLSLTEFWTRLTRYFPTTLGAVALYTGLAAVVHCAFADARSAARKEKFSAG